MFGKKKSPSSPSPSSDAEIRARPEFTPAESVGKPSRFVASCAELPGALAWGDSATSAHEAFRNEHMRFSSGVYVGPDRDLVGSDVLRGLEHFGFKRAQLCGLPIVLEHPSKGEILFCLGDDRPVGEGTLACIAEAAQVTLKELADACGLTAMRERRAAQLEVIRVKQERSSLASQARAAAAEAEQARRTAAKAKAEAEAAEKSAAEHERRRMKFAESLAAVGAEVADPEAEPEASEPPPVEPPPAGRKLKGAR